MLVTSGNLPLIEQAGKCGHFLAARTAVRSGL